MSQNNLIKRQIAIKFLKDKFESLLSKKLNLVRVSAPLFIKKSTGLNDNLSGVEETVSFSVRGEQIEIVQSLAKWKRYALGKYNFPNDTGLYTDMNAIRKDEVMDNLHSIYVDQWDWEKIISKEQRTRSYLFKVVNNIYSVIYKLSKIMECKYGYQYDLPKSIYKISSKQLEKKYPDKSPKEREYLITKEFKAVFIHQIGWPLKNKLPHDSRAADYDDWKLNGDIILFDEAINGPIELSSMGIRVDSLSLEKQLKQKKELDKLSNPYCQSIINNKLPLTIGGGIGQSRLCMYYLKCRHIGEVQSSYWDEENLKSAKRDGIELL